jgi:hypothetical protein
MIKRLIGFLLCLGIAGCAKPTDPESMALPSGGYAIVSRVTLPGTAQDVIVRDSIAYVAEGEAGLGTIKVSDPSRPVVLSPAQWDIKGTCIKVALCGNAAYLAANTYGVSAIDITDPALPTTTETNINIKPAHAFLVFSEYLLTGTGEGGVKFAWVVTPTHPDVESEIHTPGYAHGMVATADSNFLIVASGEVGVSIFDIRELRPPNGGFNTYAQVGWADLPGYASDVALHPTQAIAYVACGTAGIQVVSFADTAGNGRLHVAVVGTYPTGGYAKSIKYHNGRLYVTTELRGLQVFSIANPIAPALVGSVKTSYALGVSIANGHVYIADENDGLVIASIPPY